MVNIDRTKGIRFVCLDCKAEWMIPLSGGGKAPERCIYCGKSVPYLYIQRAMDEMAQLKEVCRKSRIDVILEEEPRQGD